MIRLMDFGKGYFNEIGMSVYFGTLASFVVLKNAMKMYS